MTDEKKTHAENVVELTDDQVEEVVGGATGAGAGKVTFNPFSTPSKVNVEGESTDDRHKGE